MHWMHFNSSAFNWRSNMSHVTEIKYNEQQTDAIKKFIELSQGGVPFKMVLQAFAGCGKTFILTEFVKRFVEIKPDAQILYVAFNKTVADEMFEKAIQEGIKIEAKTQNSYCLRLFKNKYKRSEVGLINWKVFRNKHKISYRKFLQLNEFWKEFLCSDSDDMRIFDAPKYAHMYSSRFENSDSKQKKKLELEPWEDLLPKLQQWSFLLWHFTLENKSIPHDVYVKAVQLEKLTENFDLILMDESQDTNPPFAKIIDQHFEEGCSVVGVGDSCQQIYRFRGCVDYLEKLEKNAQASLRLSHSYRFNPEIAMQANAVLKYLTKSPLIGKAPAYCDEAKETDTMTYIQRTNRGCFLRAKSLIERNREFKMKVAISETEVQALEDLLNLQRGENGNFKFYNKELYDFAHWGQFEKALKSEEFDFKNKEDWIQRMEFVEKIFDSLREAYEKCYQIQEISERNKDRTDVDVITTGHQAKGLEWDFCTVGRDFEIFFYDKEFLYDGNGDPLLNAQGQHKYRMLGPAVEFGSVDEKNLLYVAITRAKKRCWIPEWIEMDIHVEDGSMPLQIDKETVL